MYYTQADVEKAVKVLFFEGAGCVERGDVENCRIRTAFKNDEGVKIYLELLGTEVTRNSPVRWHQYTNAGYVDYCYELYDDGYSDAIRFDIESKNFEYSKQGILDFVNQELGCSFTDICVTDCFYGYHVHRPKGRYTLMDDYAFDHEKAAAARKAYDKIDKEIREKLGEKYSKISLHELGEDSITVRCYASDKSMIEHGMDPLKRYITVKFDEVAK